jgi:hypothetical protein
MLRLGWLLAWIPPDHPNNRFAIRPGEILDDHVHVKVGERLSLEREALCSQLVLFILGKFASHCLVLIGAAPQRPFTKTVQPDEPRVGLALSSYGVFSYTVF